MRSTRRLVRERGDADPRRRLHRGFHRPEGKTMGHAGAIVSGGESTAEAKSEALRRAGIRAATNPSEVAELVAEALSVA
jgi:succinyl-CoA synthetase alpha subunit